MRAYVIDSKDQDISYIPINSFVYHDGCGFIKRKQTTNFWSDTDFERIYCTDNSKLNPTIKNPEDELLLRDAELLKFVVNGAYGIDKGATITEIRFKDILGNNLSYNLSNFEDLNLSNDLNWLETDNFEGENLFNGNDLYQTTGDGEISSTIFNLGPDNYDKESVFYIRLTPKQMQVIDSIELIAGSPEGRIPYSISIFAVKNKDDVQTKVETLVFYKAFSMEIDGMRPARPFKATQNIRPDDPCMELFLNGLTEDGIHLVMNPYTGQLTSIYCEFPDLIEYKDPNDPDYLEYLSSLCDKDPRSIILTKDLNNEYKEETISSFLVNNNYICQIDGCSQFSGSEYTQCIETLCEAKERNPLTKVIDYDINLNKIEQNVEDYLRDRNIICTTDPDPVFLPENTDTQESLLSNLDEIIDSSNPMITVLNPATGEKITITAAEYKNLVFPAQSPSELQQAYIDGLISDGWTLVENLDTLGNPCEVLLENPSTGEQIIVNVENCVKLPPVYDSDNTYQPEIIITEMNLDLNNLEIVDSLGALSYKIEREIIEVPVLDIDGKPIPGEFEQRENIKIIFDTINLPEGMTSGVAEITLSDGINTYSFSLDIKEPTLSVLEPISINAPFTNPLFEKDNNTVIKAFEYDEPGALLNYYYADTISIIGASDKVVVTIEPGENKNGLIKIKPNISADEITEGWYLEEFKIVNGSSEILYKLYITKHMRIKGLENREKEINLGELIVDDGEVQIDLFNIDNIVPTSLTAGGFRSYLQQYGRSHSNRAILDISTGPCYQPGINTYCTQNKLVINPYQQQLNERMMYIIDPYFNEINVRDGLIEPSMVHIVTAYYTVNKYLTVNGQEAQNFIIDKYRFMNSKTEFIYNEGTNTAYRDLKIEYQAEGLNINIENPNILGLKYASIYNGEDKYFDCRNGGPRPKMFTFVTDTQYTDIGSSIINFSDSESEININVEVVQYIDINLPYNNSSRTHTLFPVIIGSQATIQLLHPYNNDWDNLLVWSDDDSIADFNINKETQELELTFNHIGTTNIFISDYHKSLKININCNYNELLLPSYKLYKLINTDIDWHTVDILNVQGTLEIIDNYDSTLVEVRIVNNNSIEFRLLSDIPGSTVINFNDIISTGNVSNSFTVQSIDASLWFNSKSLAENLFYLEIDTSEVFFEIELNEETI